MSGVVVLPTGAGKTVVAMKAIQILNKPSIVIVPTLDLLEQWRRRLEKEFKIEIGILGGGESEIRAVTVSTYDSAYIKAGDIGNRFSFLVADEVHHIAAEGYRQIAEMFTSPYRLGLTATLEREDMLHEEIPRLMGGVVYRLAPKDLAGRFLSDYVLERIQVNLNEDEKREYEAHRKVFTDFLAKRRMQISTPAGFQRFIMRSATDKEGRQALLARNKALEIALNCPKSHLNTTDA
jgi:superfamily II DNA or RNA helicase